MTGLAALKARVRAEVDRVDARLVDVSLKMHAHVEPPFKEVKAQAWLCELLDSEGFTVQRGLGSLPTAFRATYGTGESPRIAFLCETDGLPYGDELPYGHSCGHNVCAPASAGAGIGLKAVVDELGGTVVVLGTPAEEGGNGKHILREEGSFEGLDAMMLIYPGADDIAHSRTVTVAAGTIEFRGRAAHAAARPEWGVNAVDAMLLGFNAMGLLRQQIPSDTRLHGVITQGGTLPNVIPDHTTATVMVRANSAARVEALVPRVRACFDGAALATGCRVNQEWSSEVGPALLSNRTMADLYAGNLGAVDRVALPRDELSGAWSADTSAISWLVPTIEPQIAMTVAPPHSLEFHNASATSEAAKALHDAAVAMALTGVDLLASPDLMRAVKDEHAAAVGAAPR